MTYTVNFSDPSRLPIIVEDETIDTTTSLELVGKANTRYGEAIAENFLHLLENFANTLPPVNPTYGQLWYDTSTNKMKFYTKFGNWKNVAAVYNTSSISSQIQPDLTNGDIWVNPLNNKISYYINGNWVESGGSLIGNSLISNDLTNGINVVQRYDTLTNAHSTIEVVVNSKTVSITSSDDTWIPANSELLTGTSTPVVNEFPSIKKGINLNTTAGYNVYNLTINELGPLSMNVGRGNVLFENNANDALNGAGVTLRTTVNPVDGVTASGSILSVRSVNDSARLWVGQVITTAGNNDFLVGTPPVGQEWDASKYTIKLEKTGNISASTISGTWIATAEQAETGELNTKIMTPLRTRQAIDTRIQELSEGGFLGSAWYNPCGGGGSGTGARGYTGSVGAAGVSGSRGLAGFTGSRGTTGLTGFGGSTGELGFTGSRGVRGLNGFNGSSGANGFTGSAGGITFVGAEYYTDLADDDLFIFNDVSTSEVVTINFADLQEELAINALKSKKIYVEADAAIGGNGSYNSPFNTLEDAFSYAQANAPISITVLPGEYYTDGNLALPDECSIVSTNGQYMTTLIMNTGSENNNCILVGSGSYVQGLAFKNLVIDNLDDPTGGFAIAFRPGALILRSPYIRDISQISNYNRQTIAAPLNPLNSLGGLEDLGGSDFPNPLVGRGGGVLLADRSVLNQNSIFPYMLAFGATPRSPNGIGYCAKNGAGINGISSISIFQRTAFYSLNGGQITLNNSGTQFGDISMRAKGSTLVVRPYEVDDVLINEYPSLASYITTNSVAIIDDMWTTIVATYPTIDETLTRRDAGYFLTAIAYDLQSGQQTNSRNFSAGFFNYNAELLFDVGLLPAFVDAFDAMRTYISTGYTLSTGESAMLDALIDDIIVATLTTPTTITFGSLIESLGHQFNLAGAGVNKNALPLNFRKVGKQRTAKSSILQEDGGRVKWSGADELNNQYFAKGLRINGQTGRLEGRPFTSSVRRLARRAANSRTLT